MIKLNELVSVIIPTYNRANLITKALDSVWIQTYRPIELLIVDDGSKDNTQSIVSEWINKHNIDELFVTKYIYQENKGAPSARNNGIKNARGRYLQFLDSDDMLMPQKLTLQMETMKYEKTPLCICDFIRVDEQNTIVSRISNNGTIKDIIKGHIALSTSIALIDKRCFDSEILQWNPNLTRIQDKDFNLKLFMVIDKFSYVNQYLFKYVWHSGDRITTNIENSRRLNWDILNSLIRFNLKYYRRISYKKITPLLILYTKLLYHSLVNSPFPKFMKFWKSSR